MRVMKKAMLGWMSGRALLITNSSFSTKRWNRSAYSSGRSFKSGLETGVDMSSVKSSTPSSMYLLMHIIDRPSLAEVDVHAKVGVPLSAFDRHFAVD